MLLPFITKDPVSPSYINYKGPEGKVQSDWYPEEEMPRPKVYHEFVSKQSQTYKDMYKDLIEDTVKSITDISAAINNSVDDVIEVKLVANAEVPKREDGKITTVFVPAGKTLIVDLNGHEYKCQAYAFYVTGGTLIIRDTSVSKKGVIRTALHNTYGAIMAMNNSKVVMEGGMIDTRTPDDTETPNWMYGIVCTTGSTAEIKGDSVIHTDEASAISTNNTTGVGNFSVSGNAQLIADGCAAIYQASMDYIDIFGNAKVIGGIVARMGRITVRENARVINNGFKIPYDDFGTYLPTSNGPAALPYGVFHAAGTYKGNGEDGSNDFVLTVKDNGSIKSKDGVDVMVADLGTGYDQSSTVDLKDNKTTWQVLSYDEAKEIVEASGATLKPKIATTVITVAVGDDIVYPYLPSQDEEVPADGE
jgi:hypothetical protein